MNFKDDILRNFGEIALSTPQASFIRSNEAEFYEIMNKIGYKPKIVLEIGTASGCSALMLAQYAEKIITFDVVDAKIKYDIWKFYGVQERIVSHIIKDSSEISNLLTEEFDFAFIDGDHTYKGCSSDIVIAEKCGRILFHDVYSPPIIRAIDELKLRKGGTYLRCGETFGYWSNKL